MIHGVEPSYGCGDPRSWEGIGGVRNKSASFNYPIRIDGFLAWTLTMSCLINLVANVALCSSHCHGVFVKMFPYFLKMFFFFFFLRGRKEMFYLTMHSTHFIYGYMASHVW